MHTIRITKCFEIEMAHSLLNYDGLCQFIHGHSYKLEVTLIGTPLEDSTHPKNGMLIDFKDLKRIVRENVINEFDHSYVISSKTPMQEVENIKSHSARTLVVDYQPTCENLNIDFAKRIETHLPDHVKLYAVKLYETATSFSEWFAADNQ